MPTTLTVPITEQTVPQPTNQTISQTPASTTNLAPGAAQNIVDPKEVIGAADNTNIPTISQDFNGQQITGGNVGGNQVSAGSLIDGKTATELMDAVLPSVLVFLFYKAGLVMKKTELQLTEKEKNTLAPLMQKCLDALLINFQSPFTALAVSMGVIYGGKIIEKGGVVWIEKQNAKAEKEGVLKANTEIKANTAQGKAAAATEAPKPFKMPVQTVTKEETIVPPDHKFTEANISAKMRQIKAGRKRALQNLQRGFTSGRVDAFGNEIKRA